MESAKRKEKRARIVERVKEVYKGRGLMQRCPLSPTLFSLLMADQEEILKQRKKGGNIKNGKNILISLCR